MPWTLLFVVFWLAAGTARAQSPGVPVGPSRPASAILAGTVLDAQTGQPTAGVVFSVDGGTGDTPVTDAAGRYQIEVAPGLRTMTFRAPGYHDTELTDIHVEAGESADVSTLMSNTAVSTQVQVWRAPQRWKRPPGPCRSSGSWRRWPATA